MNYTLINSDAYLMHYGVKGMKWGVRHDKPKTGRKTSVGRTYAARTLKSSSSRSGSSIEKTNINSEKFKKTAITCAKVGLAIAAIYGAHKLMNNPAALNAGKQILSETLGKTGSLRVSVLNSTEYKLASAAAKPLKKGLKAIGSDDFRNTVTGIGAMAATAGMLRSQIKDLKENKVQGDTFDKAVQYTQKVTAIGENVSNLAQGPKAQTSVANKSANNAVSVYVENGKQIKATRKLTAEDKKAIKKLRQQDPSLTISGALYRLNLLDMSHSGLLYESPYILHYVW